MAARAGALMLAALVLAGCGGAGVPESALPPITASMQDVATAQKPATTTTTTTCLAPGTDFDCDLRQRIQQVQDYIAKRPGTTGIVLRDRQTGQVWRNDKADTLVWTASTIKLAMTVNLFLRDKAGQITLTAADRDLIQRMLNSSDDKAADTLWFKYAGADHMTFNNAFPTYGMTSLQPQKGFSNFYPYWGFQKCTPDDLDALINYVLTKLPADTRDYITGQLRAVAPDQQWGVWAAGPAAQPGNKDGWSQEQGGWVMNTVGFVGPDARYTLAVMNSLNGQGGYDDGQETDNQVAKILFNGRF
ncbi:class A beta-lactamase-related serine hydrolase [Kutzneria sp. CA-103260]|uniref:class A beta-lactamase-related serine hydrolase n=1 Tax=Kutzneria sp. CA-103260 TaxID=2802641 RepID=UPI001BF0623F|nr:class A beta-lactamase-related serine hydrolase [Kutzneria sp. CA-103260]QUQ67373.1 hypothetical protein JJ691_51070 [Kutzneria sp. CA-103260]